MRWTFNEKITYSFILVFYPFSNICLYSVKFKNIHFWGNLNLTCLINEPPLNID